MPSDDFGPRPTPPEPAHPSPPRRSGHGWHLYGVFAGVIVLFAMLAARGINGAVIALILLFAAMALVAKMVPVMLAHFEEKRRQVAEDWQREHGSQ